MDLFSLYISTYGILALSHIFFQMLFAHGEHRKQRSRKFVDSHKDHYPSVTVVVPVYNESPKLLEGCLNSIRQQKTRGGINVIVIDDGSDNQQDLLPVLNKFKEDKNFEVILFSKNQGKRFAQKKGFDRAKGEIIVTVDSDTVLEVPNGINHILKQFKNPHIGAVTGDIRVSNKNHNFITNLISYRYWTAFNQERAAQSKFDVLMCCSGPFSAYRKSVINQVKEEYVSQVFLGHLCTFGDDRHLTNLVLQAGYKVNFDKRAVAYTHVPSTISQYIKQQVRWNKSFYREMLWTLKNVHKHHFYLLYDLAMQLILPFLLVVALFITIYQAIYLDVAYAARYLLVLLGISLIRSLYGIYRTRDLGFLSFMAYGLIHVLLLIPARFYALGTIGKNGWSTR